MKLVKEGQPEMVVLPMWGEALLGATVEIFDNGMVNITTDYQSVTMHITQCTIVWWEKPTKEEKPKLLKLSIKKPEDGEGEMH